MELNFFFTNFHYIRYVFFIEFKHILHTLVVVVGIVLSRTKATECFFFLTTHIKKETP